MIVDYKPFLINGESPCIRERDYDIIRILYDKDNPQQAIFYKDVQLQRLNEREYLAMNTMRQSELIGNNKTGAEMIPDLSSAYKDKEWFENQYWNKKKDVHKIAKLCGVHFSTIYKWAKKNQWKLKRGGWGMPVSKETAQKIREAQIGNKNHAWRGGKYEQEGYVFIKDHTHPNRNSQNYISEHRVIIEKNIGRYLYPWELVHHKNGIRNDNRVENLEIKYRGNHHRKSLYCPHCGEKVY